MNIDRLGYDEITRVLYARNIYVPDIEYMKVKMNDSSDDVSIQNDCHSVENKRVRRGNESGLGAENPSRYKVHMHFLEY